MDNDYPRPATGRDRAQQSPLPRGRRLRLALAATAVALPVTVGTLAVVPTASGASPVSVDCDSGDTITDALRGAVTGDTISVSGTCAESVLVPRTLTKVTLDGQGKATVRGPAGDTVPTSPASFTFFVEGTDITIKNFTIVGGAHAVHLSGPATVTVDGNTIRESGGAIHLDKASIGQIINNTIEDNLGYGINIQENSYARIGFTVPTRPIAPNTIRRNGGAGIQVTRSSSAWIAGNTVEGNASHGVVVDRDSQADVTGNAIQGNRGDAIRASHGSGVNLESEGAESPQVTGPNTTAARVPNSGVALRCEVDGYVVGPRGTLAGARGLKDIDKSCVDEIEPRGKK
ncbi:right-handed parallel beta-helix repeat-containing protein [Georgenia yuyongxinii]|nr:right-handed parallel beta-helix repeat-containing protein [Georgenia yuyongxinii]